MTRLIFGICLFALASMSISEPVGAASSPCPSLTKKFQKKYHAIEARIQKTRNCKTRQKLAVQVLDIALDYYKRCPGADRDGGLRNQVFHTRKEVLENPETVCN